MIDPEEVIRIHNRLIDEFGGIKGLRDKVLLLSALSQPFQTFDGKDLLPTTEEKAAALLEGLISNHPFLDGNKRIGYTITRLYLLSQSLDIAADSESKYSFVMKIASGDIISDQILEWLKARIKRV